MGSTSNNNIDDGDDDVLLAEAMRIAGRLAEIRAKLVTISDKTSPRRSTSSAADDGHNSNNKNNSDVTEEEIEMANEAQGIMKRLGEIKSQLSSTRKTKKRMQSTMMTTSASGFRYQHLHPFHHLLHHLLDVPPTTEEVLYYQMPNHSDQVLVLLLQQSFKV